MTDEQFTPDTAESTDITPKPKRTRRSTRKTSPVDATETLPAASAPSNAPEEHPSGTETAEEKTAPPKPRRTRRKTVPKTKAEAPEDIADASASPEQSPAVQPTLPDTDPESAPVASPSPVSETEPSTVTSPDIHSTAEGTTRLFPEIAVSETHTPLDAPNADTPASTGTPPAPVPLLSEPLVETLTLPTIPLQETPLPPEHTEEEPATGGAEPLMPDTSGGEPEAGAVPRKSRRGRRGGRGRGKSRLRESAETAPESHDGEDMEDIALPAPAPETDRPLTEEETAETEDAEPAIARIGRGRAAKNARSETAKEKDAPAKTGRRKMFISVVPGEQVEVALVEEGAIHEYYLEMLHQAKTKGNIYKGVIHNIDTNLQAAFVSYGTGKNGFLQIDEIHPEYFLTHHEAAKGKKFPPIQKVLKAGQEVLVQVVKEPTGNKGAFLTTWLSLAGRFLVLTPGQEQIGVSRKVENDEERSRLREMMNGIDPGEGLGVIVRTVSAGTSKTTLKNDLQYLKRVWKDIRKRGTSETAPALIYQEPGLAERAVRDYLTDDVCEVWVDNVEVAESLRETVSLLFPRKEDLVKVHADARQTLWERFNIQRQLEQIYSREVTLPSGGRLVFDQTEALMAIDINSGKISGKGNFEAMALKTNLEAAETIARQLKLRDIGGQVVIDFIEMRDKNHIREVEKMLRNTMKNDRARHDVARMSSFGLLEIVRQRTGSSALAITMEPCPTCGGTGMRRNMEWQSLQALRDIDRQARSSGNGKCVFETAAELGMYLLNHKRDRLREMELQHHVTIVISIRP